VQAKTCTDPADLRVTIGNHSETVKISNRNDGFYDVSFGPLPEGSHSITVTVDSKPIKGSPFSVNVTEGVGGAEISEITFLLQAINKHGEPISRGGDFTIFSIENKGGKTTHLQDSGLEDGRYHFDYKCVPGLNSINVVSNVISKSIDGFPLSWTA